MCLLWLLCWMNTSNSFDISGTRRKSFTLPQITEKFHLLSCDLNKRREVKLLSQAICSCPQSFPASVSFPMSWLFVSGGQSIGASASASDLPMHIQGWFLLGLTGLIALLSKGVSRVFSSTTVWKHPFFFFFFFNEVKQLQWSKTVQSRFYMQGSNGEIFNWHVSQICRFPFQISSSRLCL